MTSSSTALERTGGNGLALAADQEWWNDKQLAALRQLGVDRASNGDLAVFMHVAQKTGLDPFARQIYLIERQGKQTIQTGIDGFRLVARRAVNDSGETLSISGGEWCGEDGVWRDVWLKDSPPAAARVVVTRSGQEFIGVAFWREYAQTKRDGSLTSMWQTRPAGQLAKCAEALALRKAFPMDLAGIYTDDEMTNANRPSRADRSADHGIAAVLDQGGAREEELDVGGSSSDEPQPDPASEDVVDGEIVEAGDSPKLDMRSALAKRMFAVMGEAGIPEDRHHEFLTRSLQRPITSRKDLTDADARTVIDALEAALEEPFPQDS